MTAEGWAFYKSDEDVPEPQRGGGCTRWSAPTLTRPR